MSPITRSWTGLRVYVMSPYLISPSSSLHFPPNHSSSSPNLPHLPSSPHLPPHTLIFPLILPLILPYLPPHTLIFPVILPHLHPHPLIFTQILIILLTYSSVLCHFPLHRAAHQRSVGHPPSSEPSPLLWYSVQ